MKKLLWIGFGIILFLSGISYAFAETGIETASTKNGNVELKLNFEEGYVGAIDVTLNISSNMEVTNVIWNTSFPVSYTKRYTYDKTNHTVKLYVATGSNTRNLVDKNGVMNVGSLVVKSTNGKEATYTVSVSALSIVDANYTTIKKTDLKLNGNNQFTYQVNSSQNNSNGNTTNNSNQTNNGTNSNDKNNTIEKDSEEEPTVDEPTTEPEEDQNQTSEETKKPVVDDKQPEQVKVSEAKKSWDWKVVFGLVVIAILSLTLISTIIKNLKD